ncbi:2-hydroxyacid dehydrogenase [Yinghuangia soli]|uniref:2-hydroxyacid dehydrogenase n=1 Tax=Yinghuangia soli TaxID=2908204 RepID=A0AA41Q5B2_9ACTN|nr:2-hydroxyacid dehydrogenase [Yinghuangia soli]MCF2531245.1 2-hydroxyacid dehydrogenase [Yinghuangia soli]
MEILAYGVESYERPLLVKAFDGHHALRCLDVNLDEDTAVLAAGHELVSTNVNSKADAEVLRRLAAGGTRLVTQRSTGFNNIDLDAAARYGITVMRVSHYSPHSVAEFAWALAQAANRHLPRAIIRTRDFDFRLDGLLGRDMHGKTVGVVGTGKIGEVFTRIAHGHGCELLGWDIAENPACRELGMEYVELPELLSRSDVVSLHVPLTPETHHLIDAAALDAMREDALLVNTSRGGLVDTFALVAALRRGLLGGVALDVYEEEEHFFYRDLSDRVVTDDVLARLMTYPNVLVTSHQAFFTQEAVDQILGTTVRNVADFLAGRTTENTLTA